ncbi:hypothetical protein ACSMFS_21340 [Shewanella xiamenensis]|uniref:hypothetical protein n=1 Tax=Shewanella TaxID=22 RepID=UPI001056F036|nr:hypothetical protein [Shewanella decolorationis]
MVDIAMVSAALTSIKTATDVAKLIKDGAKQLDQAEFRLKLADLLGNLADAKIEIVNITELLAAKDAEIRSLQAQLELKDNLIWEEPFYWKITDGQRDGPFCQQCFDASNKLIRCINKGYQKGVWHCHTCKSVVVDDTYNEEWAV